MELANLMMQGKIQYSATLSSQSGSNWDGQYDAGNDIITLAESAFRDDYTLEWILAHEEVHAGGYMTGEDYPNSAGYACAHLN